MHFGHCKESCIPQLDCVSLLTTSAKISEAPQELRLSTKKLLECCVQVLQLIFYDYMELKDFHRFPVWSVYLASTRLLSIH
ncbi:UNVERIFIED_CONTAM: hypothetical protein K2H54_053164 [Gekko kuhli]